LKRHEKDLEEGPVNMPDQRPGNAARLQLAHVIGREWKKLSAEEKGVFKLEEKEEKAVFKLEEKEPAQDQQKRKRISFTPEVDQAELQRLKADISKKAKAIEAQVRARNREYYS
jgi:hypothetical protein